MALFLQIKAKRAAIDNFDMLDIEQEIKTTILLEPATFRKMTLKNPWSWEQENFFHLLYFWQKKLQHLMDHLTTFQPDLTLLESTFLIDFR